MQTLTMNDFGRELTMEELDLIAGGWNWGTAVAGGVGGAVGGSFAGPAGAAVGGAIGFVAGGLAG